MSTTFAKAIKSRVNRHGSLLASRSAALSFQDLNGICMSVSPRAGGRPRQGCTLHPSSLATVCCRSLTRAKDWVTGRETRRWESFTAVSTGMAGRESVDLNKTIPGSIDCPRGLTFLYERFLCRFLSPSLAARDFMTLTLWAGMGAVPIVHRSLKSLGVRCLAAPSLHSSMGCPFSRSLQEGRNVRLGHLIRRLVRRIHVCQCSNASTILCLWRNLLRPLPSSTVDAVDAGTSTA